MQLAKANSWPLRTKYGTLHCTMKSGRGLLLVVSSPSGAGKTTLCRALRKEHPHLRFSVSYTTRAPRVGEIAGADYHFVSDVQFDHMIEHQGFAEWAFIHGRRYGTSVQAVQEALDLGHHVLFDIDYQGAESLLRQFPVAACLVYILPPSLSVLATRLRSRGTETEDRVQARLRKAKEEISHHGSYRYLVLNDSMEHALHELSAIYRVERGDEVPVEIRQLAEHCLQPKRAALAEKLLLEESQ